VKIITTHTPIIQPVNGNVVVGLEKLNSFLMIPSDEVFLSITLPEDTSRCVAFAQKFSLDTSTLPQYFAAAVAAAASHPVFA
jgi:hypothetical protein